MSDNFLFSGQGPAIGVSALKRGPWSQYSKISRLIRTLSTTPVLCCPGGLSPQAGGGSPFWSMLSLHVVHPYLYLHLHCNSNVPRHLGIMYKLRLFVMLLRKEYAGK